MARDGGGGGGAFGWTLLGILVGVAGTLAVETLLSNRQPTQASEDQQPSRASLAVAAAPAPPRALAKAPVSAAPPKSVASPVPEDVQDDAAAAGMTSRSRPLDDQSRPGPAGAVN